MMAQYKVFISEPAENDLCDIVRYISKQLSVPMTAMKMLDLIEDAIKGLSNMPKKYPLVSDERLSAMGYRKLIVNNYIVFFTINERACEVDVERIIYERRNWIHIL